VKAPRALLLAAGAGTRLKPLTDAVPKCLVPVGNRPLLSYWIAALADAGVRDAWINTHHLPALMRQYIRHVNALGGLRLHECHEPRLLGSAGTLAGNRTLAAETDTILVIYCDNFSDVHLSDLITFHRSHSDPVTLLLFRAPVPRACGIVALDTDARITAFTEKPAHPASDLANGGVYVTNGAGFREMADMNGSDIAHDVLPAFLGRMRGWLHPGYHLDVGTYEAYQQANADAPRVNARRQMDALGRRPAVFLDRDGVLIDHVPYLSDPGAVRLLPGAAQAVLRLRRAGYACVVVSNQSGVGRGLITEQQLAAVSDRMAALFAEEGTVFDAVFYCPVAAAGSDRTVVEHADRKPGPGMLLRAAQQLHLDLSRSWMVGDAISDILAGLNAGCRGSILIPSMKMGSREVAADVPHSRAAHLGEAADLILDTARREERQPA
jgi:histidinol-phosphate phosphatase family protein